MSSALATKRRRPVVAEQFGSELLRLREERDLSCAKVCARLREWDLELNRSVLQQYEYGCVAAPDPVILWALARIYHVDLDQLISMLWSDRVGKKIAPGSHLANPRLGKDQMMAAEQLGKFNPELRRALLLVLMAVDHTRAPAALLFGRRRANGKR